mmetsp:Transcript_26353/g.39082  ORF Transcript_26353/g.39082 Transcript_26353/m.39082 type:complete len:119 (+) Transcript_26353:55-411(+)
MFSTVALLKRHDVDQRRPHRPNAHTYRPKVPSKKRPKLPNTFEQNVSVWSSISRLFNGSFHLHRLKSVQKKTKRVKKAESRKIHPDNTEGVLKSRTETISPNGHDVMNFSDTDVASYS